MRLLLVEDDADLVEQLRPELKAAGYALDLADNGSDGLFMGLHQEYDAVILDLGLPGLPGRQLLDRWRGAGRLMPVLILTARSSWRDKVDALKAGADDYLTKPFYPEELLARLQALIRRAQGRAEGQLWASDLRLDEERQQLCRTDALPLALTGTEFRLLRYFMLHPGKILSKTRLTEHVYDQDFDRDSNLIEVYVRRLREKLGPQHIETRRGQGYVFHPEP
ncbi:response regulator transcription factor [Magnetovirga frankeli]|uniref:response regulator transcription factor n=1 Tax=Magnetovirga frankeli TaxID=947516 RepID=UPI001292F037|nr:response regulator transcription factor [gamma proteobacterium SS-5]